MSGLFNGSIDNEIPEFDTYCPKCGGSGILPHTNELCDCINARHAFGEGISCLDIPRQYSGKTFNPKLIPKDCGEIYINYLTDIHNKLVTQKLSNYNCLICSPIAHSKTIMAYDVIENLYRKRVPTFPIFTTAEMRNVLNSLDIGQETTYGMSTPASNFTKAPYIFVKIPILLEWSTFPLIMDIMDRRVRRGLSTIFLFDGDYNSLIKMDRQYILQQLQGNGSYMTLDIHKFFRLSESSAIEQFNREIKEFQIR